MTPTLIPALHVQRAIYDHPRGPDRFRAYTTSMIDDDGQIVLPIGLFNPMGHEHVIGVLDELIAGDAEAVAAAALAASADALGPHLPSDLRLSLVVVDDVGGAWTERGFNELQHLSGELADLERGWLTAVLWTSEAWPPERVRMAVRRTVYRLAWQHRHGVPQTVAELIRQEGAAASFSGAVEPSLAAAERAAIRAVIGPHRDATELAVRYACLFGDEAAERVGYAPLGLPARAGFAFAASEAEGVDPVAALA